MKNETFISPGKGFVVFPIFPFFVVVVVVGFQNRKKRINYFKYNNLYGTSRH